MLQSLDCLSRSGCPAVSRAPVTCRLSDELYQLSVAPSPASDDEHRLRSWKAALDRSMIGSEENEQPSTAHALEQVAQRIQAAVAGHTTGFPGPMCSPLRRSHTGMLRSQPYTLTEKSDGVRLLTLVVKQPRFPRWVMIPEEVSTKPGGRAAEPWTFLDHLVNVASLEHDVAPSSLDESTVQLVEDGGGDGATTREYRWVRVSGSADTFELTRLPTADGSDPAHEGPIVVRRHRDRSRFLAIVVDRTMTAAHLILNSPVAPFRDEYEALVVDGELMMAHETIAAGERLLHCECCGGEPLHKETRVVLGLFDLFSYQKAGETARHLTHETMPHRYDILKAAVLLSPYASLADGSLGNPTVVKPAMRSFPGSGVAFFAKEMWSTGDFASCLARITCEPSSRRYWFAGPYGFSQNDGFIFTPDVFVICSGASRTQVKWKWRSLLSVDWLVRAYDEAASEYTVSLFFRKLNHGFREDTVGHWKRHKPVRLLNPHRLPVSASADVVVECVFNHAARCWSMERVRQDRSEANSIVTAISVFESLAENITLTALCGVIGLSMGEPVRGSATALSLGALAEALDPVSTARDPAPAGPASSVGAVEPPHAEKRVTTKLGLRAIATPRGGTSLVLVWLTNTGNPAVKNGIPCTLCLVRECSGLGLPCAVATPCDGSGSSSSSDEMGDSGGDGSLSSDLEDYLYIQLANAGGSCAWSDFVVDACFDGAAGRWVIAKLHPHAKNSEANFDWLLNHLQWLIENGGGDAAVTALPPSLCGPPADIPRATIAETRLTNEHYAGKAKALGAPTPGNDTPALQDRGQLRRFNNWVKAVVLAQEGGRLAEKFKQSVGSSPHRGRGPAGRGRRAVAAPSAPPARVLRVLDVCCGRGGDLLKWRSLEPAFLYMTDASFECVAEAAARYCTTKGLSTKAREPGVPARFAVHDAFDPESSLHDALLAVTRSGSLPFHLASCQFSIHYGCHSEERLEYFLRSVSSSLAPAGGVFVGTTVNDAELLRRFREASAAEFGSAHYRIRFPPESAELVGRYVASVTDPSQTEEEAVPFGIKYFATVEQSVTELPEYVVPWRRLVTVAARHGLHLLFDEPFRAFADRHEQSSLGQALLSTFTSGGRRARDADMPGLALSREEEEAASLYRVFAFEKN